MISRSLSGQWQFKQVGSEAVEDLSEWMPAKVPGCVHTSLLELKKIPDPFVADYELDVQWVAKSTWEFYRSFEVSTDILKKPNVFLVCDGLDTLAEVYLNDELVGKSNNMFRQYRWNIKPLLKEGTNEINIKFESTVNYVTELNEKKPLIGVSQAIPGGPYIRKAPCQFGWDWGPMLPPIGIWKDIRLEGYDQARIRDFHIHQEHKDGDVTLRASYEVEKYADGQMTITMEVFSPSDVRYYAFSSIRDNVSGELSLTVPDPELWWPNGYGKQTLYRVVVSLTRGTETLDQRQYRIGFRTIVVQQKDDEWGKSFKFFVNGIYIFAKGSNWIPADSFPTRLDRPALEKLIHSAAASHQNMLRVWGGGFYEDENFYDLCDEYGILVWQDMAFSCSIYPMDEEEFLENVKVEIFQNVSRLRHRASLAIWCGNNEMEMGWETWGWQLRAVEYKDSYDNFFHHLLPEWLRYLDPDRLYWPSSPSSNTPFKDADGQTAGDAHYWEVWHGRKPFTAYRTQFPRFMSEFGFQSLPPMRTIQTYADESDWNMTSYIMEHHQRSGSGNGLIIGQMTDSFRMPKDFQSLSYLSMVLQAEGIRYGVEHWRRNKHRVSGTLYWQLDDCWPVASWSSLDYFGRWKALHYAAKRFYAPLLLSVMEQDTEMEVSITSDLRESWSGEIEWMLVSLDGDIVESGVEVASVAALESKTVFSIGFNLTEKQKRGMVFVCSLVNKDGFTQYRVVTFVPNKHLSLEKPGIVFSIKEKSGICTVEITAKRLARFVELQLGDKDIIYSDNYFDIPAGKTVRIQFSKPKDMSVDEIKRALRISSLIDSYR